MSMQIQELQVWRQTLEAVQDEIPRGFFTPLANRRAYWKIQGLLRFGSDEEIEDAAKKIQAIEGVPQAVFGDGSKLDAFERLLEIILKYLPQIIKIFSGI